MAGSSGSYFYEADHIIQMKEYQPEDITEMAKAAAQEFAILENDNKSLENEKVSELLIPNFSKTRIWLKKADMRDRVKMKVMGRDSISINKETIDLRYVEQLVDTGQLAGIANIVWYTRTHLLSEDMSMTEMVNQIEELLKTSGFEKICAGRVSGNLTVPRRQEIFACMNRWRY